ncbi:gamma-glutamyl-gamma-aminobutyrate hydrolase family protein [Aeromicrobium endophyticum]|uniref:Gamma-glutamyl-gamma-aminobutyrate hydrolase family protein n=1 Tax=Aeromicrobium endophyticum TaxID=2292704 RepID=A0A371PCE0_9ACTN|nr:gamma-glutamyl-gamma-aminobutyrate hydrolase family protein [Aeromicrobium endophyticum]REK73577.1 gamma-glutamyl-gamma-aminobutyrate hydrolase family protein [Aeromicrobium endophyticum]
MKPLIGVSTYREQARWGVWDQLADVLPAAYAQSVERAGGVPVLLPPGADDAASAVVARLDGLLIAGGADVDPSRYDAEPHARTASWREDRDAWELALLDAAPVDLPVLGICRGMQVMAVHAGGTLVQHVPDVVGSERHSPGGAEFGDVDVDVLPGTRLAAAIGDKGSVRCHHHQAVRDHPGFVAAACAADGTLEAIEHPGHRFRLAVQWHPETRDDAGLFRALVAAAASEGGD